MTAIITAFTALLAALSRYWIVGLIIIGVLMLVLLFKDDEKPRFSAEEAIDRKLEEIKSKEKKNHDMEYKSWLNARDYVVDDLKCRAYEAEVKLAVSRKENEELKAENDALRVKYTSLNEELLKLQESPTFVCPHERCMNPYYVDIDTDTIEIADSRGVTIYSTEVDSNSRLRCYRLPYKLIISLAKTSDFVIADNICNRKDGMAGTYRGIPVYCTEWNGGN